MTADATAITAITALAAPPELDIDPYSTPVLLDPHPFYRRLLELGPVVRLKPYGVYAVGRHQEAQQVLSDPDCFTAAGGVGLFDIRKPGEHRPPNPILEKDPPDHTGIRKVVVGIVSPAVVRGWRAQFEQEAAEVAEQVLERAAFDGVEQLAEAFVMRAFARVLGVEMPRQATLAISEMSFNRAGPFNALRTASEQRAAPYMDWYADSVRRKAMRPGSVGAQLHDAEAEARLPPGTAEAACRVLVRAGTDTTIAGIGFALHHLARDPAQWALVKADPNRVRDAFEEAIRHESPSYTNFRTTTREVELGGHTLAADTKIGVFLGAAGRDPRVWQEPDRFDLERRPAGNHLAFGTGMHSCLGQMIARLEAECLLKALVTRSASLQLDATPTWRAINQLRTLDRLPLRVTPA